MTDREMLEYAAKAAGIDAAEKPFLHSRPESVLCKSGPIWNPLTNDGDAFRLAVKLDFMFNNLFHNAYSKLYSEGVLPDDPCATTRKAIVRAAAEIGRVMK
jgi:hypothetical protein